jgi:hypothetical protein
MATPKLICKFKDLIHRKIHIPYDLEDEEWESLFKEVAALILIASDKKNTEPITVFPIVFPYKEGATS